LASRLCRRYNESTQEAREEHAMTELISQPLVEIARALRERRLTADNVVEAAIARHQRFGERLHAYSLWTPEKARQTAKAADMAFAAGATVGPLQGIPISIKDLYAAEGLPCFAGSSRRLPAEPWEKDGPIVETIRRQLGAILGKTHMVEFAFGGTGLNSHHGAPSTLGMPQRIVRRAARRAVPASAYSKVRRSSLWAAIRPGRFGSPPA
jgi:hypothetical protein